MNLIFIDPEVKIKWHILPWRAADWCSCCLSCVSSVVSSINLPARQCSCTPTLRDNQPSGMGDTRFHFTTPVVPNSPDLNPVGYRIWGKMQCSGSTRRNFVTLMNWSSAMSGAWLDAIMSGTNVSVRVDLFVPKEDKTNAFNIWLQNTYANFLFPDFVNIKRKLVLLC